jgi:betaine-aldehyde dehydrogenase
MFYADPLHVVSAHGVWMEGADGTTYLDAYNNVPHVGHGNPSVIKAMTEQAARLNIHTRYLTTPVIEYAELLLATFSDHLGKVFFTNSGSEANELALRVARQHTGHTGVLVSDYSYHGNTTSLALATTGLPVREPLGSHVRALTIPDLASDPRPEADVLAEALAEARRAITSLQASGHGVATLLFDPLFSTEGLLQVPRGYVEALCAMVRDAGGLVIADEVQSGFGRTGLHMWGHELYDIAPDFVVLGKPMGNGHPMGAVVTTDALLDEFGRNNLYFNTFAGNPVSAAVGRAVLTEMGDRELQSGARLLGERAHELLEKISSGRPYVKTVRGTGMFFGLELIDDDGNPDAALTKTLVEDMRQRGVLISKIGASDNVLKIRPPLVFEHDHLDLLVERLADSFEAIEQERPIRPGPHAGHAPQRDPARNEGDIAREFTTRMLIDGEWHDSDEHLDTIDPVTERTLASIPVASEEDVDAAVRAARRALEGEWGATPGAARGQLLHKLASLLERDADLLALLESLDIGKPVAQPTMLDVPNAIATFRHFAGWADKIQGDAIPTAGYMGMAATHSYTVREPVGVIGAIVPWNTPLMIAAWKLAPALAAGNTVVVKPSEDAPLSVLHLARLVAEAGFPAGVVNVVPGPGEVTGAALVRHPHVDKISFTGSPEVGRQIQKVAADTFKRVTLELGGKSPQIVMADADLDAAINGIALGLLFNQGQVCAAGTRVLVHRSVYDAVVDGLRARVEAQVLGDPFDAKTTMGPLVSRRQQRQVEEIIETGKREGGRIVATAPTPSGPGYFVAPTVFADLDHSSTLAQREIFGPVGVIVPFDDIDEAIALANGTQYGLAATVWTRDVSTAHLMARRLRAGAVWVNGWAAIDPALPWGGMKASGVGRELGWAGILANTEEKTITVVL